MRKQDYLLSLIKSLNANEKRYFRLFAGQQEEEKQYLKLFDALEDKEHYDATELSRTLNIPLSKLSYHKHYLTQTLLKSIRFYKDDASLTSSICNSVMEAKELIDRRLYDFALEIIEKAIERATKEEAELVTRLIRLKVVALSNSGRYDEAASQQDQFYGAQNNSRQHFDIASFYAQVIKFEHSRKSPEEFQWHDHPVIHLNPAEILSHSGQVKWFAMMGQYCTVVKNLQKKLELVRTEVAFYEASPALMEFAPFQYLGSRIGLVVAEAHAGNYENAWYANEKLIQLLSPDSKVSARKKAMLYFAYYNKAELSFILGKYETGALLSKDVYAEKDLLDDYVRYTIIFVYAKTLMHLWRSAEAISLLDEILQINTEERLDMQPYIRPLMILAQLDQGHYQVVPYLVKSSRSWMKRRKISEPGVDEFLSHAYAISKAPESQRKEEWKKLQEAATGADMAVLDREIHLQRWLREVRGSPSQ